MILFKKSRDLTRHFLSQKIPQKNIGFVPTMGALHDGHLSLLHHSISNNEVTVCSIFVNPTQFNDPEDFKKYPVTTETDIEALELAGTDILFLPDLGDIYPHGTGSLPTFDLGRLEEVLEGKYRPGHFQGVCQVMSRLLAVVRPGNLYMGQKDYQQCMVINRLLEIMNDGVVLHKLPTLREADGLAMSSRNMRLSEAERKEAATISAVLRFIKQNIHAQPLDGLLTTGLEMLVQHGFRVDYLETADSISLEPVVAWDGSQPLVALVAAYMNNVRLIDNMILTG